MFRSWFVAASLLEMTACGGEASRGTPSTTEVATRTEVSCSSLHGVADPSARADLFDAISGVRWQAAECTYYPAGCATLALSKKGNYTFAAPAPAPAVARHDSGSWNFDVATGSTGVLCFDGAHATPSHAGGELDLPSAMPIALQPNGSLVMGAYTFTTNEPLPVEKGTASDLPDVKVASGFIASTNTRWKKTNTFDRTTTPGSIDVDPFGAFVASDESAPCSYPGVMAWDKDMLVTIPEPSRAVTPSSCGTRAYQNTNGFFDGTTLVLGDASYSSEQTAQPNEFEFDPFGSSVRVVGSFDGTLRAATSTTIHLTFKNVDASLSRSLMSISASLQVVTAVGPQFLTSGDVLWTETRMLGGVVVKPGTQHEDAITIAPPVSGELFALRFNLSFSDPIKTYNGSHTYITAVAP